MPPPSDGAAVGVSISMPASPTLCCSPRLVCPAEFMGHWMPGAKIYIPDPTWCALCWTQMLHIPQAAGCQRRRVASACSPADVRSSAAVPTLAALLLRPPMHPRCAGPTTTTSFGTLTLSRSCTRTTRYRPGGAWGLGGAWRLGGSWVLGLACGACCLLRLAAAHCRKPLRLSPECPCMPCRPSPCPGRSPRRAASTWSACSIASARRRPGRRCCCTRARTTPQVSAAAATAPAGRLPQQRRACMRSSCWRMRASSPPLPVYLPGYLLAHAHATRTAAPLLPAGVDPTLDQWKQISAVMKERHLFPFLGEAGWGWAVAGLGLGPKGL